MVKDFIRHAKLSIMLLMHISDIHFTAPECLTPSLDPDRPFRTRLMRDARARTASLGKVDALLISGDIAGKGKPEEFAVAEGWIRELATAVGCSFQGIYVVPGNHDVDRSIVMASAATRNAQRSIMNASESNREREFRTQFMDSDSSRALLAPHSAYNEFAKVFDCQIYSPERLFWKQELTLEQGVRLHLFGLTTTLLSGAEGRDDTRNSLYLSPLQTVLDPVDNVVNLVMCHHPPDWLLDHDSVDEVMCSRAPLQLFGHKHRQRVTREAAYMRFSAGAVNPSRYELGWQPGYNLIDLRIDGEGADRALHVAAHVLYLQPNPERFVELRASDDGFVFRHRIAIPEHYRGPVSSPFESSPPSGGLQPNSEPLTEAKLDAETVMSNETSRNLVYRFWNLSISQRREIALKLSLISEAELKDPEPQRYGRALLRAAERKQLDTLEKAIADAESL